MTAGTHCSDSRNPRGHAQCSPGPASWGLSLPPRKPRWRMALGGLRPCPPGAKWWPGAPHHAELVLLLSLPPVRISEAHTWGGLVNALPALPPRRPPSVWTRCLLHSHEVYMRSSWPLAAGAGEPSSFRVMGHSKL